MRVTVIVSGPLDSSMKPRMQETWPKQTMLKVKKDLGQRDLEACLVKGIELGQPDDALMDSFDLSKASSDTPRCANVTWATSVCLIPGIIQSGAGET